MLPAGHKARASDSISAGLLMYRMVSGQLEVMLAHPGGPYFKNKDEEFWGLPKGLLEKDETPEEAARREFVEETGFPVKDPLRPLGTVTQKFGKTVYAWAFENDINPETNLVSNTIEIEWPPGTGKNITIPEVDRAAFFSPDEARRKISPRQRPFIERLEKGLGFTGPSA